jgi:hypothetical protein
MHRCLAVKELFARILEELLKEGYKRAVAELAVTNREFKG